jgi:hypothetical protein
MLSYVSEFFSISTIDPDDGDRGYLWNVGFELNTNMADCLRIF